MNPFHSQKRILNKFLILGLIFSPQQEHFRTNSKVKSMKIRKLTALLAIIITMALFSACGNNSQQEAEQQQIKEEIQQLEAEATELDSTAQEIKADTKALQDALDALDTGEEN